MRTSTERAQWRGRPDASVYSALLSVALIACNSDSKSDLAHSPANIMTGSPAGVVGAETQQHKPGSVAKARDYTLRVLATKNCQVSLAFSPPAGIVRIGVEVAFEGLSERAVPLNPFYATVTAPNGERFEPTLAGCLPGLKAQRLKAGQTAQGWISFDVPESRTKRLSFRYSPVVIGVGTEELVFSLGD